MRRSLLAVVVVLGLVLPAVAAAPASARPSARVPYCDPIDTQQCLLPFPDNFFTVADATTATGVRLHFPAAAMPKNAAGTPIDPTDWNRQDGFSPGSAIMVRVPNLDLQRSGFAPITDIARSLDADAPAVLLDTNTGQRVPYWAEFDTWNPDPATHALVIRPARDYIEGHRIIVALRDLKNSRGHPLRAPEGFARLRNHRHTLDPVLKARQTSIGHILADLARNGISKHRLYLAWDFTVASAQGLAGGVLHMRDDAYTQLGSGVPSITVTHIDEHPSADVLRRVQGTFDVPKYLTGDGSGGSRLVLGPDGLPVRNGTYHAEFRCLIPASSVDANGHAHPGRGWVYGHGLLGSTSEIEGFAPVLNQYDIVLCATPEIGMASDDVGNVVHVLSDLSTFGSIPDRLDQGMVNMQFLARLLKDPNGFGANAAFKVGTPAASAIVPNEVFYNGNSQGGIFGGAATAISKEWTRAVLGVPAMNYSELLPRSVDFDEFLPLLRGAYPDPTLSTLLVQLDQIQWDRGDPNGFAQHLTSNPYPGTPNHTVLLIEAFGDHQVANIGTETEARTIGAFVHQPVIAPGRSNDVVPFWDIPAVPSSPFSGSVVELWDFGTPAPPTLSLPPESPQYGSDPHGAARKVPAVISQVSQFLQPGGTFVNVCGNDPCHP